MAYFAFIKHGRFPHEVQELPEWERAAVYAFVDEYGRAKAREAAKLKQLKKKG